VIHNFSLVESTGINFKSIKLENKVELIDNIVRHFAIPKEIVEDALDLITNFEDAWN
jgi:predicted nucleotidyltransferase